MASLVLGIAGSAIGPSLFGAGFSLFGATITGAESVCRNTSNAIQPNESPAATQFAALSRSGGERI